MSTIKNYIVWILIFVMLLFATYARISAYGDLRLSIPTIDTPSFVTSSRAPLFSFDMFAGRRLFTTNLLYKLLVEKEDCAKAGFSNPALGQETLRETGSCFQGIVILQNIASIIGWIALAIASARWMKSPPLKLLAATTIVFFGFTPHIAEWDSVLGSESLSLSFYALLLALVIELSFRLQMDFSINTISRQTRILLLLWAIILTAWIFVRDVHLYTALITLVLIIPLLFHSPTWKHNLKWWIFAFLAGLLILGWYSSQSSPRWKISINAILEFYIFPHETRTDYFIEQGMPRDIQSDEFHAWFDENASIVYLKFLVTHHGFVFTTVLDYLPYFRSDFVQPYFDIPEMGIRDSLIEVGEIVHPQTLGIYLVDLIILSALINNALHKKSVQAFAWAWTSTWMFTFSALSLFLSYFGDPYGVRRHLYPSVESFRLFFWVYLFAVLDLLPHTSEK